MYVSIHAPVKARLISTEKLASDGVSIHAPVKARQNDKYIPGFYIGFNPRAREGATSGLQSKILTILFSIHAPVKARHFCQNISVCSSSFNPRAREGATGKSFFGTYLAVSFNPRAREGATIDTIRVIIKNNVSIHAPVKARLIIQFHRLYY